MGERSFAGWIPVFESGTDYEADIVRSRLVDAGIEAELLQRRDHAFNLNVGYLASVLVLVPPGREDEARRLLASAPLSDAELVRAAMAADPSYPGPGAPSRPEGEGSRGDTDREKFGGP